MSMMRLSYQCDVCGRWGQDPRLSGYCVCGASAWTNHEPPPPRRAAPPAQGVGSAAAAPQPILAEWASEARGTPHSTMTSAPRPGAQDDDGVISGADASDAIVDDFGWSRLNDALGGIMRGAVILMVGGAGAGKSTAAAELAAAAADHWSSPEAGEDRNLGVRIYWWDADQRDTALIRRCFQTARVEPIFESRVRMLKTDRMWTWEDAFSRVPDNARVLVVDSLERWGGPSWRKQLDVLLQIRAHPAWLKIVLSGSNKEGDVAGIGELERADDATVFARAEGEGGERQYVLTYTKKRWSACASVEARVAGRAGRCPAPSAAPAKASPALESPSSPTFSAPPPRAPAPALPDFSPAFLARAARWETWEIERYRGQCRAKPVPPDMLAWWNRAVEQARARLDEGSESADPQDEITAGTARAPSDQPDPTTPRDGQ